MRDLSRSIEPLSRSSFEEARETALARVLERADEGEFPWVHVSTPPLEAAAAVTVNL